MACCLDRLAATAAGGILAVVCLTLAPPVALGATYFVDASAPDDGGTGSRTRPKKYLVSGLRLMSARGGDTLVLEPGIYAGRRNSILPTTLLHGARAGFKEAARSYNIIRASVDGGATIRGVLDMPLDSAFLQFEGLKWDSLEEKKIVGHHLKFIRCAFENGPATGNVNTVTIGTNDRTPGARDVLVEDSWVYGPGGRYKLLVFNSQRVVLRRVVVRHDAGWIPSDDNPQGGIAIYNSQDVALQNGIVLDSDLDYADWLGAIAHVQNRIDGTLVSSRISVRGSIVLNIANVGVSYEGNGAILDAQIANTVIWKVARSALTLNGGSHLVLAHNLTVGDVSAGDAINLFGGKDATLLVRNSIVSTGSTRAFYRQRGLLEENNNNCYSMYRYAPCASIGDTSLDPRRNGLSRLPRVDEGSALDRARLGANVTTRIGVSGTLYGEPGFDESSREALWPWPLELRLKTDLCEGGIRRGLCGTGLSLTEYIWNFLDAATQGHEPPGG